MTIVRVGTTKKYSDGWESAFGKSKGKNTAAAGAKTSKAKKAAKASAKKKSTARKRKK